METEAAAKLPTIVVVDDSSHDYETYVRYLGKASPNTYQTKFLSMGKQILNVDEPPHCALLDLIMPDITGLEILPVLKKNNRGSLPFPIVMVTGSGDEFTGRKAVQLGAQDYLIARLPVPMQNNGERLERKLSRRARSRICSALHLPVP
jgi:CheY-like chemotaxis protein